MANSNNLDTDKAWEYHNGTNHGLVKGTMDYVGGKLLQYKPLNLDVKNRPLLFKRYQDTLETVSLKIPDEDNEIDALQTLVNKVDKQERFLYLESLSKLLHYSAGITKTIVRRDKPINFRAASCTGALFHIEMYVITSRLPGLDAGVYHYDPENNTLQLLRNGDYRKFVAKSTGNERNVEEAPVIIAYTSAFWRNATKYLTRAYRHAFWDSAVVIANSLAIAQSISLNATLLMGFVDKDITNLLLLDNKEEIPLGMLALGYTELHEKESLEVEGQSLPSVESKQKFEWPPIIDMHVASSLTSEAEVIGWRDFELKIKQDYTPGKQIQLKPQATRKMITRTLEKTVRQRGSTRKFSHDSITLQQFSNLMKMGLSDIPSDFYDEPTNKYNQAYVIVNAVDDLSPGSYRYNPETSQLETLRNGYMRENAKILGLNQDLAHDAAAIVFFLVDLDSLIQTFGNRGYRVAQMEGSIWGGKMYLAAYAQGFGATGLTFLDKNVTTFFNQEEKIVTFMICIGHKAKK